ncbi:MAG: hypothetical protein AseanaTS_19030 [Candidatus Pelagadaptatus aseana]|uniref:substrate-binding periplasmic protein n=1 Tax=Candidatus Pelagadaptatus aseana TaxID=3120508 RepID=UPI0039B2E37E
MIKTLWFAVFYAVIGLSQKTVASAPDPFVIYTYHDKPPYYSRTPVTSGSASEYTVEGLYPDFIGRLSELLQRPIEIQYLPRRRLEQRLKAHILDGAVIGVNPVWFKDKDRKTFLWTEAFMQDRDVVAVRHDDDLSYNHPNDLIARTVTVPRGYYLWGVSENIKSKKQRAILTSSELQSLKLIATKRADATIISEKTLQHMIETTFRPGMFKVLPVAHDSFDRHFLFPKQYRDDYELFNSAIQKLINSPPEPTN